MKTFLGTNEKQLLLAQERQRHRLLRLQAVRAEEVRLARNVRNKVKQSLNREMNSLLEGAHESWELEKREKLEALQEIRQRALNEIGGSERMAQLEESLQRKRRQELQRKKKEFIRLETQRSKEAGIEFRREVHKRNESMEKKLKALEKVNQIEKERTARIVEKQKIHASKAVNQYFDQTVLSKPKMNELKQKSYDRTTFHNNHAAVRCEGTTYDARAVAPMVQKQLEVRLIDEEKRRISSQQKADSRFDTALIDVKMEKTKNNLMDEIGILDRKRRQIASSNVSYKPKYAQQQLESEFLQRFIV